MHPLYLKITMTDIRKNLGKPKANGKAPSVKEKGML